MKYSFLIFLAFSLSSNLFAQESSFFKLFEEVEFEQLQVYSFDRIEFKKTDVYPYKGQKINKENLIFLEDFFDSLALSYNDFFAVYHYPINKELEGFLVRESISEGTENMIYCLIYDLSKQRFIHQIELANAYSYESASGGFETWLIDLNKDGYHDFLTYSQEELLSMENGEVDLKYIQKTFITFFEKKELKEIEIIDTLFKKQLLQDFPFYQNHYFSFSTQNSLNSFLTKQGKEVNKTVNNWAIIIGSDKDLESAINEKKRFQKIFKEENRYGIYFYLVTTYQNNGRFYTILDSDFKTKTHAQISLRKLQKNFNKTAYIIDLKQWCPNYKYVKSLKKCE